VNKTLPGKHSEAGGAEYIPTWSTRSRRSRGLWQTGQPRKFDTHVVNTGTMELDDVEFEENGSILVPMATRPGGEQKCFVGKELTNPRTKKRLKRVRRGTGLSYALEAHSNEQNYAVGDSSGQSYHYCLDTATKWCYQLASLISVPPGRSVHDEGNSAPFTID